MVETLEYILVNWVNGIASLAIVCAAVIFVIMAVRYYRKTKARTFAVGTLLGIAVGIGWTGHSLTFLSVAILGYNLEWIWAIIGYFSFSTIPMGALAIVYVSWDIAGNRKSKKVVLGILAAFSVVYYIVLYAFWHLNVQFMEITRPDTVIHDYIPLTVPMYYLLGAEVLIAGLIAFIGFLRFRMQVPGELRKKSTFVLIASFMVGGSILWDICAYFDAVQPTLFVSRFLMVGGLALILKGLMPVSQSKPAEKTETASARSIESQQLEPSATPPPTNKACPACSATLPITAKFCNMCGLAQARQAS